MGRRVLPVCFFSSRRRHTRCLSDWSSDVCSSDLTALVAAIGNGSAFRRGRDLAAWVGMVPRECSTGGKQKLLGISKRGNSYLRRLFVQGARSVLQQRNKQPTRLS